MPDRIMNGRLRMLIKSLGITKREFERRANLSNGFVDKAGDSLQRDKMEKILHAFPDLSRNWLLFGEGTMLTAERDKSYFVTSDTETVGVDNIATTTGKCSGRDSITHNHHMMNNYNAPDMETLHRQYEATIAQLEEIIRGLQETIKAQQETINRLLSIVENP